MGGERGGYIREREGGKGERGWRVYICESGAYCTCKDAASRPDVNGCGVDLSPHQDLWGSVP